MSHLQERMIDSSAVQPTTNKNGQADVSSVVVHIAPSNKWFSLRLGELWAYRDLLYFLVWRDLKARYKQTALGALWIVLQPLAATIIFTVVFGRLAGIPSGELPYAVFAFAGLLPWNYFASSLTRSGTSLVTNSSLVTKVYFPRLLVPLAGIVNGLVDFGISLLVLICLMLWYGVTPGASIVFLPFFLLLVATTALGVSLWLSALNVQYRDVTQLLPVLVQMWMYASPIVYASTLIPEQWRPIYALNPMVGIIEGFRWVLTGTDRPPDIILWMPVITAGILLITGLIFFRRTEQTFADII
jgi:lipopolysaccharide transport system permease protein